MQGSKEEDTLPFTKVKIRDILAAALVRSKADKLKKRYKRSLGISWSAITKDNANKAQMKSKNEEMMQKYLSSMTLNSFLTTYENKQYSLAFINKLISKYRKVESLVEQPNLRIRVVVG